MHDHRHFLAIAVGNTRTRFGLFHGKDLADPVSLPNTDFDGIVSGILRLLENVHGSPVVISSVNSPFADKLERAIDSAQPDDVYRIGRDLAIPMQLALDDASTVGEDRLLCAFGAYQRAKQACIVVDAGTAITVDFVDGEGVFHGGVIAPGLRMMLASLHEKTAALPAIEFSAPDPSRGPFGKDTHHAMLLGVHGAAVGLVHLMLERFAEHYEAYPQVVATGGDAAALFDNDPLVEHIVPDLQLVGILETCLAELDDGSESDGVAGGEHGADDEPEDD